MPLLELKDVRTEIRLKRSTVHALDGVSLSVDAGRDASASSASPAAARP